MVHKKKKKIDSVSNADNFPTPAVPDMDRSGASKQTIKEKAPGTLKSLLIMLTKLPVS